MVLHLDRRRDMEVIIIRAPRPHHVLAVTTELNADALLAWHTPIIIVLIRRGLRLEHLAAVSDLLLVMINQRDGVSVVIGVWLRRARKGSYDPATDDEHQADGGKHE